MVDRSFEYYSLFYLNQWFVHDRLYCAIWEGNEDAGKCGMLQKAATFYRVARTYHAHKNKGENRYKPLVEILEKIDVTEFKGIDDKKIINKIMNIKEEMEKTHRGGGLLSLTTKFLWLRVKSPILIYDSQACRALDAKKRNLDCYYEKWHESFEKHKSEIEKACCKLSGLRLYSADQKIGTQKYITEISSEKWFHERVHDVYLWDNKGCSWN